jgi:hypothetical protein
MIANWLFAAGSNFLPGSAGKKVFRWCILAPGAGHTPHRGHAAYPVYML